MELEHIDIDLRLPYFKRKSNYGKDIVYRFKTDNDKYIITFERFNDGYSVNFCIDDGKFDLTKTTNYGNTALLFKTVLSSIIDVYNDTKVPNVYLVFNTSRETLKRIIMKTLIRDDPFHYFNNTIKYEFIDNMIKLKIIDRDFYKD